MTQITTASSLPFIGRYIFVGIVTVAPLWATWQIVARACAAAERRAS